MEFSLDLQKQFSVIKVHLPSTLLTKTNTLYGVLILCLFWYSIKLYSLKLKYKNLHLLYGCKACILIQKSGMFYFQLFTWYLKNKWTKPTTTHERKRINLKVVCKKPLLYEKGCFDEFSGTRIACVLRYRTKVSTLNTTRYFQVVQKAGKDK